MRRVLSIVVLLALTGPLAAQVPALSFTGGAPGMGSEITAGWRFNVNVPPLAVVGLGVWDAGGDGLAMPHEVGIWTEGGILVTMSVVPAGVGPILFDGFRYVPISPVTLTMGLYRIGAYYSLSDPDAMIVTDAAPFTIPQITYIDRAFTGGPVPGLTFPETLSGTALAGNFGPNFAIAVPEPTTVGLLALVGLGGTGAWWWRREKAILDAKPQA